MAICLDQDCETIRLWQKEAAGTGTPGAPRTGVNDHAWEREHRHPTAQLRAMGYRRRDAEVKLDQRLAEAQHKAGDEPGLPESDGAGLMGARCRCSRHGNAVAAGRFCMG